SYCDYSCVILLIFLPLSTPPPPLYTLFPSTTLFRSLRSPLVVLGPHSRRRGPGDVARVIAECDVVTVHVRRFRTVVTTAQVPGRQRTPGRHTERRRRRSNRTPAAHCAAVTRCRTTISPIPLRDQTIRTYGLQSVPE